MSYSEMIDRSKETVITETSATTAFVESAVEVELRSIMPEAARDSSAGVKLLIKY